MKPGAYQVPGILFRGQYGKILVYIQLWMVRLNQLIKLIVLYYVNPTSLMVKSSQMHLFDG